MANRFAVTNGNFNDTATWSTTAAGIGGASVPGLGDSAYANNKTVTITDDATCVLVSNTNGNGSTAGGGFLLNDGVSLTAAVAAGNGSSVPCITYAGTVLAAIIGNIAGWAGSGNSDGVAHTGLGVLNITGNVAGGGTGNTGARVTGSGTLNITGALTSGNLLARFAVVQTAGILNIVGSQVAVYGGALVSSTGGVLSITGNCTAGNAEVLLTSNNITAMIVGTITASNTFPAISSSSSAATISLSGQIVNHLNGRQAIHCAKWKLGSMPTLGYIQDAVDGSSTYARFYTADNSLGQAVPADVRSGVSYASGSLTGTMKVPGPGSVLAGTPVDAAVGTAVLTPDAVWNHLVAAVTTPGSIGERVKQAATVASVGAQLSAVRGT